MELKAILILLEKAVCPEDVFGKLNGEPLSDIYRRLAKIVHPDKARSAEKAQAEEAFKRLQSWYEKAETKVAAGTYGDRNALGETVIETKSDRYVIERRLSHGDIAEVFLAQNKAGAKVVLKITRTPANNDLLANEAKTLRYFRTDSPSKSLAVMAHIPELLDSFELRDGKAKKRVNVIAWAQGGYTLAQVREAYPSGLDLRDAAWMWNRMLGALLAAHQSQIIHGAVLPEHFVIFPESHNGILIDWCYAVAPGAPLRAIVPARRGSYPLEVMVKRPATTAVDLYMAAVCLRSLLSDETFANLPRPVVGLLRSCWLGPAHRPQDAWQLFNEFGELLKALYGPRKFRPFAMPESASTK